MGCFVQKSDRGRTQDGTLLFRARAVSSLKHPSSGTFPKSRGEGERRGSPIEHLLSHPPQLPPKFLFTKSVQKRVLFAPLPNVGLDGPLKATAANKHLIFGAGKPASHIRGEPATLSQRVPDSSG